MSKARHRADGGRTKMWVSGNPDVKKEAEGEESYAKGDEKKRGGKVKRKLGGPVHGSAAPARMDRPARKFGGKVPGRKRGGGVGADTSPLSTAHKGGTDGNRDPGSEDTYGGTPSD